MYADETTGSSEVIYKYLPNINPLSPKLALNKLEDTEPTIIITFG
jgi:hypothetical protein